MVRSYTDEIATTLSPDDYFFVRQYLSLKGLLKPFKGKGEYDDLVEELGCVISRLDMLAERLVTNSKNKLPLKYLPFNLCKRKQKAGATYLTWRQCTSVIVDGKPKKIEIEGKQIILNYIGEASNLSLEDKQLLIEMEKDRLTLNMQMRIVARTKFLICEITPKLEELEKVLNNQCD